MAKKTLFRAALFGGYNKEDVHEYIQTLENEIEAVKVLNQKEKNELQRQLDESREKKAEEDEELPRLREDLEHSRSRLREKGNGAERKAGGACESPEELEQAREELAARPETYGQEPAYIEENAGEAWMEEGAETGGSSVQKKSSVLLNENAELKARLESLRQEMRRHGTAALCHAGREGRRLLRLPDCDQDHRGGAQERGADPGRGAKRRRTDYRKGDGGRRKSRRRSSLPGLTRSWKRRESSWSQPSIRSTST